MEWESGSPCHSHTNPRQGHGSPGRCRSWELERGGLWSSPQERAAVDCGETDWGGVREVTVVGNPCGGKLGRHGSKAIRWLTRRGWSHHHRLFSPHASTGSWTMERLAHQTLMLLNYRVGPHPGWPFECLTCPTTEKDPRQGSPLSAWKGGTMVKVWPKRPLHTGSLPSCPTLCGPVHCGLPGFSVRESASQGKNAGVYWPTLAAMPF